MKRIRLLLAAGLAGLLLVTGCSGASPTAAATVNGVPISVAEIEEPVRAIGSATGEVAGPHAIVLSFAIRGRVARAIATQRGIELTGEPRATVLRANPELATFATDPRSARFVDDVVDNTLVIKKLGEGGFGAELAKAAVQVNPRYGSWSVETGSVSETGGQLSLPWADPKRPR